MKLRILSLAHGDLLAGRDFYEMQQAGLGAYFLDTLFSDIESLLLHAGVHAKHLGYYRALSKRFPYAVYYKLDDDCIDIWRILDCRRNPHWIAKALPAKDEK